MAATLILPTDSIDVAHLPLILYGPPGCGKTSIAQTANQPLTLDFDKGIHRSFNRKAAFRFDTWEDCLQKQEAGEFRKAGTLVLDTLGSLLDAIGRSVMAESAKNCQGGGLSISGWGVLGNRFATWLRNTVAAGQDVIMVCHEEEDRDVNGQRYLRPSMPGKMAYTAVHRLVDLMGHIGHEGNKRFLDFSPTELAVGKNAAQFDRLWVGRLEESPDFLAALIRQAKAHIGKTAQASAAVAGVVEQYAERLAADPTLEEFNAIATEALSLRQPEKRQVAALITEHAKRAGLMWDKKDKLFRKEAAA